MTTYAVCIPGRGICGDPLPLCIGEYRSLLAAVKQALVSRSEHAFVWVEAWGWVPSGGKGTDADLGRAPDRP